MQTDKEFEDFFRERLNGLEETPPFNAWEKIKEDIKPPRTYYREMAAVMLLCLISAFIFLGIKTQQDKTSQPEIALAPNQENADQAQPAATKTNPEMPAAKTAVAENAVAANTANKSISQKRNNASTSNETSESISGNSAASNIAAEAVTKNKPVVTNLHAALVKKEKTRKVKTENSISESRTNNLETAVAINTKTTRPAAFSAEKRYDSEVKNASKTVVSKSEKDQISAKGINPAATFVKAPVLADTKTSETKTSDNENASLNNPKTETILAQNTIARTDSVALPAIPELAADSADAAKKSVAQRDPEAKKNARKFAVTVNFTPGVIARRLIANPNDDQYVRFTEGAKKGNATNLGYDLSAILHHRVSPKTTIDGGFSYTKLHSHVNYQVSNGQLNITANPNPGSPSGAIQVNYIYADEEIQNEFAYGGLRVGLTQELVKTNANAIFVSGGAGLNTLLSNHGTLTTTKTTGTGAITQTNEVANALHTVNSHVYLSAGLERTVLSKVSILVAPAFTYYLNSAMQKKHIFEMKPYTIGLNFGLRYQL